MRVLVTGSRDWPYSSVIERELNDLVLANPFGFRPGSPPLVVVEGACHLGGADKYAYHWAQSMAMMGLNVQSERHPADWKAHGKAAGPIRNQEMVDAGAGLCLAFILNDSRGATDCLERAIKARIHYKLIGLTIEEGKVNDEAAV